MRGIRSRDSKPELAVRSAVHALGLRYQVAVRPDGARNSADLVFSRARVAVFVDGCFWHGCPIHGREPRNNREYWLPKLEGNRARDARVTHALRASGWEVLRFWAHEEPFDVAARIRDVVRDRLNRCYEPRPASATHAR